MPKKRKKREAFRNLEPAAQTPDYDEKIDNSINDSGISLNEYEGVSRGGTPGYFYISYLVIT